MQGVSERVPDDPGVSQHVVHGTVRMPMCPQSRALGQDLLRHVTDVEGIQRRPPIVRVNALGGREVVSHDHIPSLHFPPEELHGLLVLVEHPGDKSWNNRKIVHVLTGTERQRVILEPHRAAQKPLTVNRDRSPVQPMQIRVTRREHPEGVLDFPNGPGLIVLVVTSHEHNLGEAVTQVAQGFRHVSNLISGLTKRARVPGNDQDVHAGIVQGSGERLASVGLKFSMQI